MAKRRKRRTHSQATKLAAVKAKKSGESWKAVTERYKVVSSVLNGWIKAYDAGELGDTEEDAKEPAGKAKQPKLDVSNSAVHRAIVALREAEANVDMRKRTGKLKKADEAHTLAQLALRILEGDDGR